MADETFAETSAPAIQGSIPEPFLADEAEAIAKLYRRLVLLVGAQLLVGFGVQVLPALTAVGAPQGVAVVIGLIMVVAGLGMIAVGIYSVVTTYRLAGRLKAGLPVLWAVAMFLPCVNIITLLVLSAKAQSWCRRHGVKVGFFGPTKESIEQLRQRSTTSVFE